MAPEQPRPFGLRSLPDPTEANDRRLEILKWRHSSRCLSSFQREYGLCSLTSVLTPVRIVDGIDQDILGSRAGLPAIQDHAGRAEQDPVLVLREEIVHGLGAETAEDPETARRIPRGNFGNRRTAPPIPGDRIPCSRTGSR